MTSLLTPSTLSGPATDLSDDQLAALANTFGKASVPVSIHDAKDRCLDLNTAADQVSDFSALAMRFEILDHQDRVVGFLAMTDG